MNIDVDFGVGHFEKDENNRKNCGRNNVAIGVAERVLDEAVADEASIDEGVDGVAVELLDLRLGDEAVEAEMARIFACSSIFLGDLFAAPGRRLRQSHVRQRKLGGD